MKSKWMYALILLSAFILMFNSFVLAYDIVVRPHKAIVQTGASVQFEAQAFTENGVPVFPRQYDWQVIPASLGRITEDGFFIAGREPGRGEVLASAVIGDQRIIGQAFIQVGAPPEPEIKLVIRPDQAVVEPGDTLQFKAVAISRFNRPVAVEALRWLLLPPELGTIHSDGLFVAGARTLAGQVVAVAEIGRQKYRAEASLLVAPKPDAGISGQVVNELGNPLAGAAVSAHRLGPVRWHANAVSDLSGGFVLGNLIPGLYVVRAAADGYLPEYFDNMKYMKEATAVTVVANDTTPNINFSLAPGASIAGAIVADSDNSPLAGAHVIAIRITDKLKRHGLSDENGNYIIDALENGTYMVWAQKDGFKEEYYNDKAKPDQADLVSVTAPNAYSGIDFSLALRSAILGTVVDEMTGTAIEGAVITARPVNRPDAPIRNFPATRTDAQGEFTLELPAGSYYLHAMAPGYAGEFYDNVQDITSATVVQVLEDQHTMDIQFSLTSLGAITGQIRTQEDNQPLAGALVKAFREGPGWEPREIAADSLGNYRIDGLPAGNYVVMAWAKKHLPEYYQEAERPADATIVKVENATDTENIDFTLSKGGVIAGSVYSSTDDTPLAGAQVKVTRVDGRHLIMKGLTDARGHYQIEGLPSGKYLVQALAQKHIPLYYDNVLRRQQATPVKVVAPQVVENIDFKLTERVRRNSAITGQVVDEADGTPIYGALVLALRIGGRELASTYTGSDGQYELNDLNPGRYIVYVAARGYLNEFYDNVYHWWQATPITVPAKETITDINFALTAHSDGLYLISGNVVDAAGNPVEGALVFAESETGYHAGAVSDETGHYILDGLTAGSYKVMASMADYQETFVGGSISVETASVVSVGMGQDYTNADITLAVATEVGMEALNTIPDQFALQQNFPNPFNPTTTIRFDLPEPAQVTVEIYNLLGQKIKSLLNENRVAGRFSVVWDGKDEQGALAASGLYFYRMEAKTTDGKLFSQVNRMLLLK